MRSCKILKHSSGFDILYTMSNVLRAASYNPYAIVIGRIAIPFLTLFAVMARADDGDGFQYRDAILQSFFAFSIAHAERFSTELGSREAMSGAFWKDYARDVQAFHGWDDGDGFKSSYIAHPMEGAMAGYIARQNAPKYRSVEYGTSRRYWISVMRSLAFSTAYNMAWSHGPPAHTERRAWATSIFTPRPGWWILWAAKSSARVG